MLSIDCQSVIDWKDKIAPDLSLVTVSLSKTTVFITNEILNCSQTQFVLSVQETMRHYEGQTPKVVLNALLNVAFLHNASWSDSCGPKNSFTCIVWLCPFRGKNQITWKEFLSDLIEYKLCNMYLGRDEVGQKKNEEDRRGHFGWGNTFTSTFREHWEESQSKIREHWAESKKKEKCFLLLVIQNVHLSFQSTNIILCQILWQCHMGTSLGM